MPPWNLDPPRVAVLAAPLLVPADEDDPKTAPLVRTPFESKDLEWS